MILRPVSPAVTDSGTLPIPAWEAIFPTQRRPADRYLLISQDDHAHLAGDVAAALRASWLPELDSDMVDAIRLHDCGWRALDDEQLARAREGEPPVSFLDMGVAEFLSAWTESIEHVAARSPVGGAVVSLHFSRLAEYRLNLGQDAPHGARLLAEFLEGETQRRRRLTPPCGVPAIPFFTDALQLCDLISLYLCCGTGAAVEFPQFEGKLKLRRGAEVYIFDPSPLCTPLELSLGAAAWPPRGSREKSHIFCSLR